MSPGPHSLSSTTVVAMSTPPAPAPEPAPAPRPSEPLSFSTAPPATLPGRIWYDVRDLGRLARHLFSVWWYGPLYDRTPAERDAYARQQARSAEPQPARATRLGSPYDSGPSLWLRQDRGALFLGEGYDAVEDDDVRAHAGAAWEFVGGEEAAAACLRLVRFLGTDKECPQFEVLPHGALAAFVTAHPEIFGSATRGLRLRWLLHLASALAFLHARHVAHCALNLSVLWLREDASLALFGLTHAFFDGKFGELIDTPFSLPWHCLGPDPDVSPEDLLALGRCADIFSLGSLAYYLLSGGKEPDWEIPEQQQQQQRGCLDDLRALLRKFAPELPADLPARAFIRACWTLEYQSGGDALRALVAAVQELRFEVQGDDIVGMADEGRRMMRDYRPQHFLGNGSYRD
ncbi:uncharacterized protein K452DRAFT_362132 [Aplosporella prunicola CBS 121167]|uniref:Protein kinase domain-containing protein n=1 Tax=Aplosporella prunicola CBS 121167 TaxID=1176127 RepID=A0A6A6B0Z9_9PEZI|nr:uncharacterized protein K452DRAFT_362132 [Aplosporella prunicola CBS 121167]KAF2137103.1 hypothetical protein K452DRAFT_362132 [Aplosporella prunicola CBS 121167]